MSWILLREPSTLGQRGTRPVEAHKGAQEPSARLCARGVHTLDQSNCGVSLTPWRDESQFLLQGMCFLGWICMPNDCLQRCPGAVCSGSGLRGPLCWSGATRTRCQWPGLCLLAAQRSTQGPPAGAVGSGGLCAGWV